MKLDRTDSVNEWICLTWWECDDIQWFGAELQGDDVTASDCIQDDETTHCGTDRYEPTRWVKRHRHTRLLSTQYTAELYWL